MKTYNNLTDHIDNTIDYLDSFKDIVTRDIKNETTSEEKTILYNEIDLWLYNLRVIRRDVEFQLGSNKSKNKLKALEMKEEGISSSEIESFITKQNQWRINTIRFLASIEKKMLYVKMLEKNIEE
jgi:predicted  nucleic acid-binding Zn ribbon protein